GQEVPAQRGRPQREAPSRDRKGRLRGGAPPRVGLRVDQRSLLLAEEGEPDEDREPVLLTRALSFETPDLVDHGTKFLVVRADPGALRVWEAAATWMLRTKTIVGEAAIEMALGLPSSDPPASGHGSGECPHLRHHVQ